MQLLRQDQLHRDAEIVTDVTAQQPGLKCDPCENQGFRSYKHMSYSMDEGAHYDSPTFRGY